MVPAEVAATAGVSRYAARVLLEAWLALELVAHEAGRDRPCTAARAAGTTRRTSST